MMDALLDDAFSVLKLAKQLEEEKPIEAATKYYEAVYLWKRYLQILPLTKERDQTRRLIEEKVSDYEALAFRLLNQDNGSTSEATPQAVAVAVGPESPFSKHCQFFDDCSVVPLPPPKLSSPRLDGLSMRKSTLNSITDRAAQANARLSHALDLDESGNAQEAIAAYTSASELYLEAIRMAESTGKGAESVTLVLKRRLSGALDRLEELKHPRLASQRDIVHDHKVKEHRTHEGSSLLTAAEIAVLKRSSLIASGVFLPWSEQDAQQLSHEAQRSTSSSTLWTDPAGFLKLSDNQSARFHKWARPSEIVQIRWKMGTVKSVHSPVMVKAITPYTIRQKYVTDCSFIASLCICAAFERQFGRGLVTSLIHPQTPNGMPMVSPSGKYMVKLWLNGVSRQVIVDDYLPVDRFGNVLYSHTTTKGLELWVSIVEKAYMKLCGGYDFPGSNSGVDLLSLSGWIPERIFFPKNQNKLRDFETPPERAWERLCSASSYGDCLITMSTSADIGEDAADAVGLVTGHAYAVLSVIQTKARIRLLQLKNPWAYKAWRGSYSCHDLASWSNAGLSDEVGYDPQLAAKHDDGVFWICWEDVLVYFQNIHLSWNPSLFSFQTTIHSFWPLEQGPLDDTFNVGENPQYILHLSDSAIAKGASIWILLSRHVTKQEQEGSDATDYLTVHVHRNNGKHDIVWYPGGKNCVLSGAYTNNPHVLARFDASEVTHKHLSLVLSQYKKSHDLGYTLKVFCTEPFSLSQPAKELPLCREIASEWTTATAGGPPGERTFQQNPMWSVRVPVDSFICLRCTAVKAFAINVMLVPVETYGERLKQITQEPALDSGPYRHGFTVTERKRVPGGVYTLIASTFNVGEVGRFRLTITSSSKLMIERIPS